jgi:hypothetical protein
MFGLTFGKEFNVSECKKILTANTTVYEASTDTVCFERGRVEESTLIINDYNKVQADSVYLKFPTFTEPQIMNGYRMYAVVVDKNLEGIVFDTEGITTSELVMENLRAKYNSPSLITPIQVSRGKSKIDAFRAEWHLKDLYVSFLNVNFAVDTGVVYILTDKGNRWYGEQMKRLEIL